MKIWQYEEIKKELNSELNLKFENDILIGTYKDEIMTPKNHNKCFGRGYEGRYIDENGNKTDEVVVCSCIIKKLVAKNIELKSLENVEQNSMSEM